MTATSTPAIDAPLPAFCSVTICPKCFWAARATSVYLIATQASVRFCTDMGCAAVPHTHRGCWKCRYEWLEHVPDAVPKLMILTSPNEEVSREVDSHAVRGDRPAVVDPPVVPPNLLDPPRRRHPRHPLEVVLMVVGVLAILFMAFGRLVIP